MKLLPLNTRSRLKLISAISSDFNEPNLKDLCSPLSRNHSECENEEVAETQTGVDTTGLELRLSEDLDNALSS